MLKLDATLKEQNVRFSPKIDAEHSLSWLQNKFVKPTNDESLLEICQRFRRARMKEVDAFFFKF